jgi:endonuclease YncB( thermonuclease family)
MPTLPHIYRIVAVVRVVDGDSGWVQCDAGFRQTTLVNYRLFGYDTPERHRGSTREKNLAVVAAVFADAFLKSTDTLWMRTEPDPDNFGRWLSEIWREDEAGDKTYLGAELHEAGLASVWPSRWHEEFDTAKG